MCSTYEVFTSENIHFQPRISFVGSLMRVAAVHDLLLASAPFEQCALWALARSAVGLPPVGG